MYVSVKGALKWYDPVGEKYDKWEIIPSSSGDICILGEVGEVGVPAPGGYTVYTIAELLAEPTIHLHEYVRVLNATVTDAGSYAQGYGDDPNDWVVFEISDNSTSATLRIYCEREASRPLELTYGSIINVQGEFIRYETYWEIEIRAGTQDEVTVVTIATTER
jgi:sulfur carrier protein ThiS